MNRCFFPYPYSNRAYLSSMIPIQGVRDISVYGEGTVIILQGESEMIEITGDDRRDAVEYDQVNRRLVIRGTPQDSVYTITIQDLNRLYLNGIITQFPRHVYFDQLEIICENSRELNIFNINSKNLITRGRGTSLVFDRGTVDHYIVEVDECLVDALEVKTKVTEIHSRSNSRRHIRVWALDRLIVECTGKSVISYWGRPEIQIQGEGMGCAVAPFQFRNPGDSAIYRALGMRDDRDVTSYSVLGVAPDATRQAIVAAYERLAERWDPQLYAAGDADVFRFINQAYSIVIREHAQRTAETIPPADRWTEQERERRQRLRREEAERNRRIEELRAYDERLRRETIERENALRKEIELERERNHRRFIQRETRRLDLEIEESQHKMRVDQEHKQWQRDESALRERIEREYLQWLQEEPRGEESIARERRRIEDERIEREQMENQRLERERMEAWRRADQYERQENEEMDREEREDREKIRRDTQRRLQEDQERRRREHIERERIRTGHGIDRWREEMITKYKNIKELTRLLLAAEDLPQTSYGIFGLKSDATKDEITKEYRRLAKIWHPDKNADPRAQDVFNLINDAYNDALSKAR